MANNAEQRKYKPCRFCVYCLWTFIHSL